MRYFPSIAVLLLMMLSFTSCVDSLEKVNDDYSEILDVQLEVLTAYQHGKMTEDEVVEVLEKIKIKGRKILDRVKVLEEKGEIKEGAWQDVEGEENSRKFRELLNVLDRLEKSGKPMKKIDRAIAW